MNAATKEAFEFLQFLPAKNLNGWEQGVVYGLSLIPKKESLSEFVQQLAKKNGWRSEERTMRKRPCMTCGVSFQSEGKHNRLCPQCRRRDG